MGLFGDGSKKAYRDAVEAVKGGKPTPQDLELAGKAKNCMRHESQSSAKKALSDYEEKMAKKKK